MALVLPARPYVLASRPRAGTLWCALFVGALAFAGCSSDNSTGNGEDDTRSPGRPGVDASQDTTTAADSADTAPVRDLGGRDLADDTTEEDTTASPDTAPDAGESDCSSETIPIRLKPSESGIPNVVLVVDRSYSMIQNPSRWEGVTAAVRTVTSEFDDVIRFGMILFPSPISEDECGIGSIVVDPGMGVSDDVSVALASWEPVGGTPTAPSLELAGSLLTRDFPDGENYVLLATDGAPGCNPSFAGHGCECIPGAWCGDDNWGNCLDRDRTIETMNGLRALGIDTYVLGVPGSDIVSDLLDDMAVIGGTDIDGRHFAVDDGPLLLETLRDTAGSLAPCEYSISDGPDGARVVEVRVDGEIVPNDVTNGWVSDADGDIVLNGTACEGLRDGREHRLEAVFDCD